MLKKSKLLLPVIGEKIDDKNILLLQLLQPNVRVFNKYLAATLVSEGIMDYEYACGRSEKPISGVEIIPDMEKQ